MKKNKMWMVTRTLSNGSRGNFTFPKKSVATQFVKASAVMNAVCSKPAKIAYK